MGILIFPQIPFPAGIFQPGCNQGPRFHVVAVCAVSPVKSRTALPPSPSFCFSYDINFLKRQFDLLQEYFVQLQCLITGSQYIVRMSQCFINYPTSTVMSHCFLDFFPLAFFFYSIKSYNLKQHAFSIACRFDNISNCWVKIPYFLSFLYTCVCVCARAQLLSCVQLFATPWI